MIRAALPFAWIATRARTSARSVSVVLLLSALVLLIYSRGLANSPLYLHHDEVFFGVQAHSIASTAHDTHGRFLPVYFQVFADLWFQPAIVYFTALFFTILPVSEQSLRLPSVLIGLFNVILIYFVSRWLFESRILAVVAALMLALTPAHFIFSRLAIDCLYPVTFLLGWLLCLLVFRERRSLHILFVATSLLGLGFYSYIAAKAMMPMYLGITLVMLATFRPSLTMYGVAVAGFIWPLLLSIPFHLAHPEFAVDTLRRYGPASTGPLLDPFQQMRELVNYTNLSARVTLYFNFFNPGYLFLSGAPNTLNSTRQAGIFLLPVAVFLPVGIYQICRRYRTAVNLMLVLGFVTAPLAALVVFDGGAIDRELELLPFGVLLAVFGVKHLWSAPLTGSVRPYYMCLSAAGAATGVIYASWTILAQHRVSGSVVPLIGTSAAVYLVGAASERTRTWRVVTASLLLLGIFQFRYFYVDYLSDYPLRSAARFEGNLRGAVDEVIAREDLARPSEVYLSNTAQFIESYWAFYAAKHRRDDLVKLAQPFDPATVDLARVPDGSFLITVAGAHADEALAHRHDMVGVARVLEPDGTTSFIILQKHVPRAARSNPSAISIEHGVRAFDFS